MTGGQDVEVWQGRGGKNGGLEAEEGITAEDQAARFLANGRDACFLKPSSSN